MPNSPAIPIRLGSLSAKLDANGMFLREISISGEELFRGIGFVVRDANWGTPGLEAEAKVVQEGERMTIRSGGLHRQGDADLAFEIEWTLTPTSVEARGRASSEAGFETNRTGFVVLHSLGTSRGRAVAVTHPDGSVERTAFPDFVSPHQPFFDITALDYETPTGHRVRLAFEGEVFEIEDQRNWTDASYKTYCRPLRLPYPYRIGPGSPVDQAVRLEVSPSGTSRREAGVEMPAVTAQAPLPSIGTSLPPGPLGAAQAEALRSLALGHTAIEIDLDEAGWADGIAGKIEAATGLIRIDIRQSKAEATLEALRRLAPHLRGRGGAGVTLWDCGQELVSQARELLPGVTIGAGTGAFFTELNRMTAWPDADVLAWTSNPTVHGFDDDTIGETTEPLVDIVRTANAKLPGRRFHVGPMTLGLRYNPNATSPEGRRRSAEPDPRQGGHIAAAWAAATLAGFLDPAIEALTFFEPAGPKGLVGPSGRWTPAAHLLARLSPLSGRPARILRWRGVPRAAGILIDTGSGPALCLAHARAERAVLAPPEGSWHSVEELGDDGFVRSAGPAASPVALDGFRIAWLTGR
jgi:D-apionolactonase